MNKTNKQNLPHEYAHAHTDTGKQAFTCQQLLHEQPADTTEGTHDTYIFAIRLHVFTGDRGQRNRVKKRGR